MKRFKWVCMLLLLAAMFLASPFTAEAAKIKLNKKKATQPCNTAMTVLELKGVNKGKVVWKTSNKKVATCDNNGSKYCIVVSHKAGKTKVKAKVGKKTLTCTITVESISPMAEAYNNILDSENPYAFGVEDIDKDGNPELLTADINDSKAVIKFYCWDGKAAEPAGTITVDRTKWEAFLICYGPGCLCVERGHTYHFNESAVNYTLAHGTLTEHKDTKPNLQANMTLLDSGFLDLSIYGVDNILVIDTRENRKAKLK